MLISGVRKRSGVDKIWTGLDHGSDHGPITDLITDRKNQRVLKNKQSNRLQNNREFKKKGV